MHLQKMKMIMTMRNQEKKKKILKARAKNLRKRKIARGSHH